MRKRLMKCNTLAEICRVLRCRITLCNPTFSVAEFEITPFYTNETTFMLWGYINDLYKALRLPF